MDKFVIPTDPMAIALIVGVLLLIVLWKSRGRIFAIMKGGQSATETVKSTPKAEPFEEVSQAMTQPPPEGSQEEKKNNQLNTGSIKCICFRNIDGVNVVDFTTMLKPIGEMYQIDPSCPITGSGYIVREDKDGNIVDYDPRTVKYDVKDSPEWAYFAINWEIVKTVFFVPLQWWKSTSLWFAGLMLGIVFITALALVGA